MHQDITAIPVRPWTLNGLSEHLIVSHYENNYGGAVRTLNAVRSELAALDAGSPGYRIRSLKREEQIASKDDFENMARQFPAYDALYAFCRSKH